MLQIQDSIPSFTLGSSSVPREKPKALPEAISVKKAAEILDVHHLTIRRWIRGGWIKAYRVGPMLIRIPRSELSRMRTLRVEYSDNSQRPRYPQV